MGITININGKLIIALLVISIGVSGVNTGLIDTIDFGIPNYTSTFQEMTKSIEDNTEKIEAVDTKLDRFSSETNFKLNSIQTSVNNMRLTTPTETPTVNIPQQDKGFTVNTLAKHVIGDFVHVGGICDVKYGITAKIQFADIVNQPFLDEITQVCNQGTYEIKLDPTLDIDAGKYRIIVNQGTQQIVVTTEFTPRR